MRPVAAPLVTLVIVALLGAGCAKSSTHKTVASTTTSSKPKTTSTAATTTSTKPTTTSSTATTAVSTTATTASTTTTTAPAPTLGVAGAWAPSGVGFGQVEPTEVYLGGDPTGEVTGVQWQSWGGPTATGTGTGWYVPPNTAVANGSSEPATIIAFDVGTCAGAPAYQKVTWYFPGEGQSFDPSQAEYTCMKGYVSSGG